MKNIIPLIVVMAVMIGFSFTKENVDTNSFHVTTSKIDYNSASSKISISTKFFTEDIEKVLNKEVSDGSFKDALAFYYKDKVKFKINGLSKSMRITGVNGAQKTTWAYFEITDIKDVKEIEVKNELLLNLSGQKNIINFSANGQRKSLVGTIDEKQVKAVF